MWALHFDRRNVVNTIWQTNVVGCPMFILNKKLQLLKAELRSWNKNVFGNVNQLVKEAEAKLHDIQHQIQTTDHNDSIIQQENQAQLNLQKALNIEETFWHERS